MLSIEHISYYVPEKKLKLEDNLYRFQISFAEAKVYSKIYGLHQIPIAESLAMTEFIKKPIIQLINETGISLSDIKYVIHAHTAKVIASFDRSIVAEVSEELNLPNAISFGTSLNNCASTFNALEIASVLLSKKSSTAKAIIVVGEMAFTPTVQVIPHTSITGDAAAAALVSNHGKTAQLISMEMNTDGRFSKGIWMEETQRQLFEKIYVSSLSNTIMRAIKKANLNISDIKMIIPHNVNLISWSNVAKFLNYDINKIYLNNIKKYAHCFGADIFINCRDAIDNNLIKKGEYFLISTVGLGATFAAAVFRY